MRLPRTQKALSALLIETRRRAYDDGRNDGIEIGKKQIREGFAYKQQVARVGALEAATKLANSLGQSIEALSRAMQSEHGQL